MNISLCLKDVGVKREVSTIPGTIAFVRAMSEDPEHFAILCPGLYLHRASWRLPGPIISPSIRRGSI